jgi:hypothetical protein
MKLTGNPLNLLAARRWWLQVAIVGLAGLAAGWLVSFLLPARYTSEAILHMVPAMVSQDLLPHDPVDVENLMERDKPIVLSRNVLTTIVNNFDLYRSERRREPMEDVVEEFRKSVHIELSGANFIRVTFTYPDRLLANKVTSDLVGRIISETITQRSNIAAQTTQFFQDEVDHLGKTWLKASATVKTTPASDPRYELLVLERDQKRKEYESAAQKLGTAETLREMESRGQGPRLELLDAASLPQDGDTPSSVILLAGLGCGVAIGVLGVLWRALRRASPDVGIPSAVEPA